MNCFYCRRQGIQKIIQDGRQITLCQIHLDEFLDEEILVREEDDGRDD